MVHVKDEGSQFDAPIEVVWKYLQATSHGEAHGSSRNQQMTPINENSFFLSMEQNMNGNWVKVKNRITSLPPVGLTIEVLEGPMAGSKIINVYTAKGKKTGIDVYGEFTSSQVPENQLEHTVKEFLGSMFEEDSVGIKEFAGKA